MYLTWAEAGKLVPADSLRQVIKVRARRLGTANRYGGVWELDCGAHIVFLTPAERKWIGDWLTPVRDVSFSINNINLSNIAEVEHLLIAAGLEHVLTPLVER